MARGSCKHFAVSYRSMGKAWRSYRSSPGSTAGWPRTSSPRTTTQTLMRKSRCHPLSPVSPKNSTSARHPKADTLRMSPNPTFWGMFGDLWLLANQILGNTRKSFRSVKHFNFHFSFRNCADSMWTNLLVLSWNFQRFIFPYSVTVIFSFTMCFRLCDVLLEYTTYLTSADDSWPCSLWTVLMLLYSQESCLHLTKGIQGFKKSHLY